MIRQCPRSYRFAYKVLKGKRRNLPVDIAVFHRPNFSKGAANAIECLLNIDKGCEGNKCSVTETHLA